MAKLTLTDITNISGNPTTAETNINANSALIETAVENTLSRDGTSPNQMDDVLDMNNHQIINIPPPAIGTDVVRLMDLEEEVANAMLAESSLFQNTMPINVPIFATRLAVSLATIDASVKSLSTRGYTTEGDHGHWPLAVRVTANPGHNGSVRSLDRFLPNGTIDAANGGWWELVPSAGPFNFEAFGVIGDDATDNTLAFRSLAVYINSKDGGMTINGVKGKTYMVWPDNTSAQNFPALFDIGNVRGVTFDFKGSSVHSKYLGAHNVWGFHLDLCEDITVLNYRGVDDAGIRGVGASGQVAGLAWGAITAGTAGCKRIKFLNCDFTGGNKGIQCHADVTAVDPKASEDIEITGKFTNIYYAVAIQGGGHDAKLDIVTTGDIGRSLLADNCMGLRGRIKVTDGVWDNQQVHLSATHYPNSPWHAKIEADLKIQYDGTASLARTKNLSYLVCNQGDASVGNAVAHVKLDYDVIYPATNTNAPGLFDMDSYSSPGNLGTPAFGGHTVLLKLSGRVAGDVGASSDFIGIAKAANGWTSASTQVMCHITNMWAASTTRPVKIGQSTRGGVDRSVLVGGGYSREATAAPHLFNIHGEMLTLTDGMTAPTINSGAQIYVDTADGDLKVRFADGTVKTIVVDT